MPTVRVKKNDKYFVASNEAFQDSRLLWETRGLLGYLFTKPNDWEVRMADLIRQGPAKADKLRRMLANAMQFGYVNRIRLSLPGGTFDWVTEVYESPSQNPSPTSKGFSTRGSSTSGKTAPVLKTESPITDDRFKGIARKLENFCGALKGSDVELINTWMEKHEDKYIYNAIAVAIGQKARSSKYVDEILINWEANGYPKPREERVKDAKKAGPANNEAILERARERALNGSN